MPQMAPMNWTWLFLIFILTFVFIFKKIFFFQEPFLHPQSNYSNKNMNNLELKWMW